MTPQNIPTISHIAIIMDGNGRWASINGLSRNKGHEKGTENIQSIVQRVSELKIKFLTIFAFSTENWSRPKLEVSNLMNLLFDSINKQLDYLINENIRVIHIGEKSSLPSHLQKAIYQCEQSTKNNTGLTLNVALNYGGRSEILNSIRKIVSNNNNLSPNQISFEDIEENLLNNKHAYEKDKHVYFSVNSFKNYGKLSNKKPGELEAGSSAWCHTSF